MKYTRLRNLEVSRIGLGCMGMSHIYTGYKQPEADSIAVIHRALDLGVTLIDTAELYGDGRNEELVGRAIRDRRDKVVLATKFGLKTHTGHSIPTDSTPANIRIAVEGSLTRLGVDHIDLYYQHRIDPLTPIEETIGALAELITEGKIGHIGMSEAGKTNIRRANAVHPITALQSEYSLWTRDGDDGTLDLLRELGIGFVPYSPLGRGFLSGTIRDMDWMYEDDWRRSNPRFLPDVFEHNVAALAEVEAISEEVGCTPSQLALAWLLNKGADWSPIPGTVQIAHLEENVAAVDVVLTPNQVSRLDACTQPKGDHHGATQMKMLDRA